MGIPPPIDASYMPVSSIQRLPPSAPIEDILGILESDGGVIIEDFFSPKDLENVGLEIKASNSGASSAWKNDSISIIPKETNLIPGLVGKSSTIAAVCETPLLTQLRERILTERFTVWREGVGQEYKIDPLLSCSFGFDIGHPAPRQLLHRDDNIHGIRHGGPFDLEKQSQFACLIAGCDTTRENGATMFIPGSHHWDDNRKPRVDEICFAEMKAGSALIFLGAAYHGGGHNSLPDFRRVVYGLFFVRGTLRTEENQFLTVPRSTVLKMSPVLQALLGYKQPETVLGIVDNKDPMSDLEHFLTAANK
ncbi:hypothetical protein K431DRAFT_249779 [Polychaeton citri CBS 116435]|uniref:Phytanoyl-CoA dioxygenase n=1 Tax=Polychaeton citri CBS 116435 TaxID=1314669 RepID=A0A9P4Q600_9PEZI|nr:hypothetical protein K431DRAFT_249779 [Polychaeton citri CBS 116435]